MTGIAEDILAPRLSKESGCEPPKQYTIRVKKDVLRPALTIPGAMGRDPGPVPGARGPGPWTLVGVV